MHYSTLILVALSAVDVLAAPAPAHVQKRGTFSVGVQKRQLAGLASDGPKELFKACRKYQLPMKEALLNAMTAADAETQRAANTSSGQANAQGTGSTAANPEKGDSEYLSPVMIGGQPVVMDFDTGSSDL
jgi:hypothetical protein